MLDYDFFDMTGLNFENSAVSTVNAKTVKDAIDKAVSKRTAKETDPLKDLEREAELDFLKNKEAELSLNNAANFKKAIKKLAAAKMQSIKDMIKARAELEKQSLEGKRSLIITNRKIARLRTSDKDKKGAALLSINEIKDIYKASGFSDEGTPKSLFPDDFEYIDRALKMLWRQKDFRGINLELVTDLYALAAYWDKDKGYAGEFDAAGIKKYCASRRTGDYLKIFADMSGSDRTDNIGSLCKNMGAKAKSVFDSEEHRKIYDQYLLCKNPDDPELQKMFEALKALNESDRYDPDIAESCIDKLEDVFNDAALAETVYNHAAGLTKDPYRREKPSFLVKCVSCRNVSRFIDIHDAKKQNKCQHCGKALYKKCPKCGQLILADALKCTELKCGYVFPDTEKFNKYIMLAENELRMGNFLEAMNMLTQAKAADQTEKVKTKDLEKRIKAQEELYKKPLNELNRLIAEKRFSEAEKYAASVTVKHPNINIAEQKRKINDILAKCSKKFNNNLDKAAKLNDCFDILDNICVDFKPASDYIKNTPPLPCKELSAAVNDDDGFISLRWTGTGERNILYCLVRKTGSQPPMNENDGVKVKDGISELSFNDEGAAAGIVYSYSVFAVRFNRYSEPVSISNVKVLAKININEIKCTQRDKNLYISWKRPANCSSVTVSCLADSSEREIASEALESVTVENLEYNKIYKFFLTANYPGAGQSQRTKIDFTLTPVISDFEINSKHIGGNDYEFSWTIKEKGIDIQIINSDSRNSNNERIIHRVRSDAGICRLKLPENEYFIISAKALSSGTWVSSNNKIQLSTYTACHIDNEKSEISETAVNAAGGIRHNIEIKIKLENSVFNNINIKALVWFVRTKNEPSEPAPWVSEEEAAHAPDAHRIEAYAYNRNEGIIYTVAANDNDESYYVTLFAVYNTGTREVFSPPFKKKFTRPLQAELFWEVSKPALFGFGKRSLHVEIKTNRAITSRPKLYLCVSSNDRWLMTHMDSNAVQILTVPEKEYVTPQTSISEYFDINKSFDADKQLFLFAEDPAFAVRKI